MRERILADLQLKEFLSTIASGSPVPGGGSVAALNGAVSACLIEMVGNVSLGKGKSREVEDEMKHIIKEAGSFKNKFIKDIDRDAHAYRRVVEAYKMPKESNKEKNVRSQSIQSALKNAATVPLGVAEAAFSLLSLAEIAAEKGNKNSITDTAVAVMNARTAVWAALYNVKINLASIEDQRYVTEMYERIKNMEIETEERQKAIITKIDFVAFGLS